MPNGRNDLIIDFDEYCVFKVLDSNLAEINNLETLAHVGGGIADGLCANLNSACGANGACFNEVNVACPTTQLNGACIKPNQGC